MSEAEFPAYVPDKNELRDTLSMYYVAGKLGIDVDAAGEAICPFHADTSPSFYVFDGDDGIQRWWCQPCGRGGDIFSLIQEKEDIGFNAALLRAAEMLVELPPGYQAPTRSSRPRPKPEDFALDVLAGQQRAAAPNFVGLLSARIGLAPVAEENLCRKWDAYLRGTWSIGVDLHGATMVPHYESSGALEGCKLRLTNGRKESIPGSKYEYLYGAHLGRRNKAVVITEGESDAWYVGFAAAEEHIALDVFAMPSGAQQPIQRNWLDTLAGARTIYLALDPDTAGVEATRRWVDELNDAGFQDVRVCCLPLGRDLREAKPRISALLARARKPLLPPPDLKAEPGGYARADAKGNWYPVTTWTVTPVAQLSGGDDPGFDVTLHSRGVDTPSIIRLADLANTAALNKWANTHGEIFTGNDKDRMRIAEYLKAHGAITPEVFQTDRVGLHEPPPEYHFAGPTLVLPTTYIGQLPWRYAPTAVAAHVGDRVPLPAPGDFPWRALSAFLALSAPETMQPIMAWVVAASRRPHVREFPLLFIGGSSGVGKSTIARMAARLGGSNIEIDLGANTPFILYRTLAASSSLPVFVDEWTRLSRDDTRLAFQGIVPLLYTGGIAERGMANLNTMGYRVSAPTIIAGEDTFQLDRELERTVSVFPSRATQNHKALDFIIGLPLERFADGLQHWLTSTPYDQLPPVPTSAPNRIEYNREVLRMGWATLRAYLDYCSDHNEIVPDIPAEADLSCFYSRSAEATENVYETALMEGQALTDQNGIPVLWADENGRGTWVRFQALVGLIETRRLDIQLPGRSKAMAAYFAERYGALEPGLRVPPLGQKHVRAQLIPGYNIIREPDPIGGDE